MIINQIANLVNNFIINLYNINLHFYQILLGMFIFNVIIHYICKIIIEAKIGRRYFK